MWLKTRIQPLVRLRDRILCALALGDGPIDKVLILWNETKNARVRLHLGRYNPQGVYSLRTLYGTLYFRDNFGDITNLNNIFYRQAYGAGTLSGQGVILDIGANIGLAAAWFAYHNPMREIFCFEPLSANAAMISLNCPRARIEQVALGARRDKVLLGVDRDSIMASKVPCTWETREQEFDLISLDEFAGAHELNQIRLIKIDVEGMEAEVLEGGWETLKKTLQLVAETHSRMLHDQVIEHLSYVGFRVDSERFKGETGIVFASRE